MKADAIIDRLEKVKQTGAATWLARCPSHADKSPSLSVRELDDGRVLLHCFAGCSVHEVLGAVGLDFDALFPDKPKDDFVRGTGRPFPAGDVLAAVADDITLICTTLANIGAKPITPEEYVAMFTASGRILEARRLALGGR